MRAIREALGMSAQELGTRVHVKRQTIENLERSEANGKITLDSLNRAAKALGCRVVYGEREKRPGSDYARTAVASSLESSVGPTS